MRRSQTRLRKIDASVLLVSAQRFDPQRFAIDPSEARNVVLALLHRHMNPGNLAPLGTHHANSHVGIEIARLRIALYFNGRVHRDPVCNRILRNALFDHLQERQTLRIRRPEIIAFGVEFFRVHPVHFAVENSRIRRCRHGHRRGSRLTKRNNRQSMIANKRNEFAIGRELGIVARSLAGMPNVNAGSVAQIVDPQAAVRIKEQVLRIRSPDDSSPSRNARGDRDPVLKHYRPPTQQSLRGPQARVAFSGPDRDRSIRRHRDRIRCWPLGDQAIPVGGALITPPCAKIPSTVRAFALSWA